MLSFTVVAVNKVLTEPKCSVRSLFYLLEHSALYWWNVLIAL